MSEKISEQEYLKRFLGGGYREVAYENLLPLDKQKLWLSNKKVSDNNSNNKKVCPVCKNELMLYLPYGEYMRYNAQCPYCDSLERHRAYWMYWEKLNLFEGKRIRLLHFAPEKCFLNEIKKMEFIDYYPVDLNAGFYGIREKVDITDIPYKDHMFDLIICNHVLEHIPNEVKALSELYRVLKIDGTAFLTVPVCDHAEMTLEKEEYNTPELRREFYGNPDHVRMYGKDFKTRLEHAGFIVNRILMNEEYAKEELDRYGLYKNEAMYECRK